METVGITCERCGFQERFLYLETLGESKECSGCVARDFVHRGLMYRLAVLAQSVALGPFLWTAASRLSCRGVLRSLGSMS